MKKLRLLCFLCISVLVLAGCQHPGPRFNPYELNNRPELDMQTVTLTNRIDPAWLQPPTQLFTLGPGDRIEVALMNEVTSRAPCTVGPDGKIYFDLLPGLDVWGLTLPQTKALLERELSQYYRQQPHVSLTLRGVESRRIWVMGRVQEPGVYAITNAPTLLEAIARAGGSLSFAAQRDLSINNAIDDQADLCRAFIVRHGQRLPVDFERLIYQGDLSQNIYLEPDDFIYFPPQTAREVYVIGAVGLPRAVPYQAGMTMASAIANAGGTIPEAYLQSVAVVRGSLSQPRIAIVNYKAVVTGALRDPVLQPRDIVYVPFQPYRYLVRYWNLILDSFVATVGINGGIQAVNTTPSTTTTPTGVFIPVGSRITVTPPPGGTVVTPGPSP
jgi:polysaccharide biosynthesis/export protein